MKVRYRQLDNRGVTGNGRVLQIVGDDAGDNVAEFAVAGSVVAAIEAAPSSYTVHGQAPYRQLMHGATVVAVENLPGRINDHLVALEEGGGGGDAGASGAGITDPTDIDDCELWLDASTLALADNARVATWPDSSGNGHDATQGTAAAKPTYKTNVVNGLGVVRYDGDPDAQFVALSGAGLSILSGAPGATVACVYVNRSLRADNVGEQDIFGVLSPELDGDENGYPRLLQASFDSVVQIYEGFFGNDPVSDAAGRLGQQAYGDSTSDDVNVGPRCVAYAVDFAVAGRGVIEATDLPVATLSNSGASWPNKITPGAFPVGAAHAIQIGGGADGYYTLYPLIDADLCEIAVYSRALNAMERRELLEYLSAKWSTL